MKLKESTLPVRGDYQGGFNLIEVMVALSILAFGILAIASMQESSLLGTSRAYNLTDGTTQDSKFLSP